jgi:hypothetical protein
VIPSQPQQQAQYRPNRTALWVNDRKSAANQPDYKGNLELSYALVQELLAAFNAGQYTQDRGGQPCIKLDIALYAQQVTPGDKKPILSGQLSTLGETQHSAAARQQAAQQYQQAQAPQMPQYQAEAAPQYVQPQPQQQPQCPQQPQPQPQPAPAQPQPAPGQLYGSQPQYGSPQPMQPQQAPEGWPAHVPVPAGFAAPQPPVAPPAPVQPMPGAIHGQQRDMVLTNPDGSRPAPQYLPPGF